MSSSSTLFDIGVWTSGGAAVGALLTVTGTAIVYKGNLQKTETKLRERTVGGAPLVLAIAGVGALAGFWQGVTRKTPQIIVGAVNGVTGTFNSVIGNNPRQTEFISASL